METFDRRETDVPLEVPIALTEAFFEDGPKVKQWHAFIRKLSDNQVPNDLLSVIDRIKEFLWPATEALKKRKGFTLGWRKKEGWA